MRHLLLTFMALIVSSILAANVAHAADGPFQATGFKVGEMTADSAIVWTRTTARPEPNLADAPMATFVMSTGERFTPNARRRDANPKGRITAVEYPDGKSAADICYAAPGAAAETRVLYRAMGEDKWMETAWAAVDPQSDYTRQFTLSNLRPNTKYEIRIETRSPDGKPGESLDGGFRTAPAADQAARVVFAVSTGQAFTDQDREDGFQIYPSMLKDDLSFFVHTGDIVYYDRLAKTPALADWHWQRTYSRDTNVDFHRQVGSYFIKDDHDTLIDDCWPTMKPGSMFEMTFERGLKIFRYQVPMGERTYRRIRWGRDLEVWMVEGRDFRSANNEPDGPEKTIWGAEQKRWLKQTLAASDATFRVLISPTPIVGPDRASKRDNHSNANFQHEGDEIRAFLAPLKNTVVVCGDRPWQYHSVHPETGVREFSCGPASDEHAGGWRQSDFRDDYHKYLNVIGGYLTGAVDRDADGHPTLTFRYHDVNGQVKYEHIVRDER
ncbi:MAG: alkaline phosphatase D family protein [Pirellulaceae bacterium]